MQTTSPDPISQYQHGRVPRDVRRAQIAQIAGEMFAERGYQGTSMDELARRAGVTKPVVYEIFGNKDGLYRACIEATAADLANRVQAAVTSTDEPLEQIRRGTTAFFRFAAEQRRSWEVLYSGDARFAGVIGEVRANQARLVTGLITHIAQALDVTVDARQIEGAAHAINGASEALATWSDAHPDLTPEQLGDWMVQIVGPGLLAMTTTDNAPKDTQHP